MSGFALLAGEQKAKKQREREEKQRLAEEKFMEEEKERLRQEASALKGSFCSSTRLRTVSAP